MKSKKEIKKRRLVTAVLLVTLLLFGLEACRRHSRRASLKQVITVSIEPLRYFAEQLAGNRFRIVTLVPQGSNPETYEPTPQQLVALAESRAYLSVGNISFERTWLERLQENAPDLSVFDTSDSILLLRHTHHAGENGADPHTWTSPANARIIAANICKVLTKIDPQEAESYQKRLDALLARIDRLDKRVHDCLTNLPSRSFAIYHPALSYFARDYGLQQVSMEEGGKEPTLASLRELVRRCRQDSVNVFFVQREFGSRNVAALAKEVGAKQVEIDLLGYDWEQEMLRIAESLKNGNKRISTAR